MSKRERTFRSSMKAVWVLTVITIPLVVGLGLMARWGYHIAPPELDDPMMRIMMFYLPCALAVLLLLILALLFALLGDRELTLTPEGVKYRHRRYEFAARWQDLTLVKPPPGKNGMFISALISDGTRFARIEKLLFKDYDLIVAVIEHGRESSRGDYAL